MPKSLAVWDLHLSDESAEIAGQLPSNLAQIEEDGQIDIVDGSHDFFQVFQVIRDVLLLASNCIIFHNRPSRCAQLSRSVRRKIPKLNRLMASSLNE